MALAEPWHIPPEVPHVVQPVTSLSVTAQPPPIAPPRLTVFDTGSEQCPQGQLPGAAVFTPEEAQHALNPLQYLPVVGMIYRQATGETVAPPFAIAGSVVSGAIMGGPVGILGSVLLNLVQELARLGPDTSRPAVPQGMQVAGSESGVQGWLPGVTPAADSYTTLATATPDFLGGGAQGTAYAGDGPPARHVVAAYQEAGAMGPTDWTMAAGSMVGAG